MKLEMVIQAIPIPQPRQRTRVRVSKSGKAFAQNYTPKKDPVNAFKQECQRVLKEVWGKQPWIGAVSVEVDFVFPRPRSMFRKTMPMPRARHTTRPDADNCIKSLLDAWSGVLFFDDGQVCSVMARKWIAAGSERPHVAVMVELS